MWPRGAIWLLAAAAACALVGPPQARCQQQQQQQHHNQTEPQVGAQTLRLDQIFAHQQKLELECGQLARERAAEYEHMLQFRQQNPQIHLQDPLQVQLPAVCLFLSAGGQHDGQLSRRLEQVNWIFADSDGAQVPALLSSRTRRHTTDPAGGQLNDYFFNTKLVDSENEVGGQLKEPELEQFRSQVGRLLAEPKFEQSLEYSRPTLAGHLSPVVLIPGLLGSRLQARVEAKRAPKINIFCSRSFDWRDMWLSLRMFLPLAVDCWLDNARLEYDPASGFGKPPQGVESRVPDFGSIKSVRHLDLNSPKITSYYNDIIERYLKLGYIEDVNLFAAPYDFRLAPQQLYSSYFEQLRQLIESAHARRDHSSGSQSSPGHEELERAKVTLVCHSMGCTHALIFLRRQSAAWRQKYVRKLIALSSPWGGTAKALKAILVGDSLELPLVSEVKLRKLARTFPSISYLLPQAEVFQLPSEYSADFNQAPNLVELPDGRAFKVHQLDQLLRAANLSLQATWFNRTAGVLIRPLEPLADLRVDCVHSLNIPTSETLIFRDLSHFPDGNYEVTKGDGDGTVNHQSLMVCARWARQLPKLVRHTIIMNTNHVGVLTHPTTLQLITDDVTMRDSTT